MLRTLTVAIAIASTGVAYAQPEQFPQSAIGAEVRGAGGVTLGRVAAVERNEAGDIVAAEIPGLEPEDAPRPVIVAEANRGEARVAQRTSARREVPRIFRTSATARPTR